jgi:hypothetical protein
VLAAMESRSPTLAGFRVMLLRPSLGLAEIAWRWSFGAACAMLLLLSSIEYLNTLPVGAGDLLLLRTRQPVLISHALARIFSGSAARAIEALLVLAAAFTVTWMALASLGRAVTIQSLLAYLQGSETSRPGHGDRGEPKPSPLPSLWGLNFLRVTLTLAAGVGSLAAFLAATSLSPATTSAPAAAFLLFLSVLMLVWLAWSVTNWFLSVAAVFVVVKARDTFAAIAAAVDLVQHRPGSVFAAGLWFALAHVVAFVAATSIVALPLGLSELLPRGAVLGGVVLVTLLYFAAVDFLYIGRLAAYVGIVDSGFPRLASVPPPLSPSNPPSAPATTAAIDPDELILSDAPAEN